MGPKIYSVSDVLSELEQVKRELYNQIQLTQNLEKEKKNLSNQVGQIEEEMQLTIASYRSVLEASETDSTTDFGKAKTELSQVTQ